MKAPFDNSYWVVPDRFAAGEYPGSLSPARAEGKILALLNAGMNHFVDLTEPGELDAYFDDLQRSAGTRGIAVSRERHPIRDLSIPSRPLVMRRILDAVDVALDEGKRVYVHCRGGVGRTGTVVGCWLVRHGKTGREALNQIAEWWRRMEKIQRRPESPETKAQKQYVLDWKEEKDVRSRAR